MPNFSGIWNLKEQVQAIAAGRWTGLPLPSLFSWGGYLNGTSGQNISTNLSSPVQVGALTDWSFAESGYFSVGAVKTDGTMWAWGRNNAGQLGDGTVVTRSSPVQIGALTNWSDVDIGSYHTIARKTGGTLWAWGNNQRGQLGTNNLTYRSSPVQVGALTTWSTIAAGNRHSMATKTDGTLWAWGYNFQGQLGINLAGFYQHRSSPVQVGALTTWSKVSAGGNRSGAVKTDGTLWMWGNNANGNLGDLTTVYRSSPVQVGIATDWATLHLGLDGQTSVGIKTTGTLWSWGSNSGGTLGINSAAISAVSSPVQVGALTNWSSAALNAHVIATKTDGTLWSWGQGAFGALGTNQVLNVLSPVQVGSLTSWKKPAAGNRTGFAILEQSSN